MATSNQNLLQTTSLSCKGIGTNNYANPIYYECPDDGREYIIIAKSYDGIFFYDILKDWFIKKFEYSASIKLPLFPTPRIVLDKDQNKLYLMFDGDINALIILS